MAIASIPSGGVTTADLATVMSTLTLRQTITSTGAITIPSNITQVFAILAGGGGGGAGAGGSFQGGGGGAGGISYGWILPPKYVYIGAAGSGGGYSGSASICGPLISGGGGGGYYQQTAFNLYPTYGRGTSTTDATAGNYFANNGAAGGTYQSSPANGNVSNLGQNWYYDIIQIGSATLEKTYLTVPGITYGIGSNGSYQSTALYGWGFSGGGGGGNAVGGSATVGESAVVGGGGGAAGYAGGASMLFTTSYGGGCGLAAASTSGVGGSGGGGGAASTGGSGSNGGAGALLLYY